MAKHDKAWQAGVQEANEVFERLGTAVEAAAREGLVDVTAVAREAGLSIDEESLKQLRIPSQIHPHPFLPWFMWFPWRALWAHYWEQQGSDNEAMRAFKPRDKADVSALLTPTRVAGMVPCP